MVFDTHTQLPGPNNCCGHCDRNFELERKTGGGLLGGELGETKQQGLKESTLRPTELVRSRVGEAGFTKKLNSFFH